MGVGALVLSLGSILCQGILWPEVRLFGRESMYSALGLSFAGLVGLVAWFAAAFSGPMLTPRRKLFVPVVVFALLGVVLQAGVVALTSYVEGPFEYGPGTPSWVWIPYLTLGVPVEELVFRCGIPVAILALFGLHPREATAAQWAGVLFLGGVFFELMHLTSGRFHDSTSVLRAVVYSGIVGWSVFRWRSIFPALACHLATNLTFFAFWYWMMWPMGAPPGQ